MGGQLNRVAAVAAGLTLSVACLGCAHPWEQARDALDAIREQAGTLPGEHAAALEAACDAGRTIVDTWEAAQTAPSDWKIWVVGAAHLVADICAALKALGVEIPSVVVTITEALVWLLGLV